MRLDFVPERIAEGGGGFPSPRRKAQAPSQVEGPNQGAGRVKDMRNVEMKVEGSILTIRVDLTKRQGPSKSGKTVIIGSTDGIAKVDGAGAPLMVGLNVFTDRQPGSGF